MCLYIRFMRHLSGQSYTILVVFFFELCTILFDLGNLRSYVV